MRCVALEGQNAVLLLIRGHCCRLNVRRQIVHVYVHSCALPAAMPCLQRCPAVPHAPGYLRQRVWQANFCCCSALNLGEHEGDAWTQHGVTGTQVSAMLGVPRSRAPWAMCEHTRCRQCLCIKLHFEHVKASVLACCWQQKMPRYHSALRRLLHASPSWVSPPCLSRTTCCAVCAHPHRRAPGIDPSTTSAPLLAGLAPLLARALLLTAALLDAPFCAHALEARHVRRRVRVVLLVQGLAAAKACMHAHARQRREGRWMQGTRTGGICVCVGGGGRCML